jgi:hypothetical protein
LKIGFPHGDFNTGFTERSFGLVVDSDGDIASKYPDFPEVDFPEGGEFFGFVGF